MFKQTVLMKHLKHLRVILFSLSFYIHAKQRHPSTPTGFAGPYYS